VSRCTCDRSDVGRYSAELQIHARSFCPYPDSAGLPCSFVLVTFHVSIAMFSVAMLQTLKNAIIRK
jgi:hypothetical protein